MCKIQDCHSPFLTDTTAYSITKHYQTQLLQREATSTKLMDSMKNHRLKPPIEVNAPGQKALFKALVWS